MSAIAENINRILSTLPAGVELVAVSKFHPVETLREAYDAGQRKFGESRVQELAVKAPVLPGDVKWHFIGHLQTNKVRQLLRLRPAMIESIDSERLLAAVDTAAADLGIVQPVLMQVHVAAEESKFGFSPSELEAYFTDRRFETLRGVHICGIMGMATNTDDVGRIRADFESIAALAVKIRGIAPDLRGFDTVSMGMSDDYPLAVACGSNLVRVGTAIFGSREY
ncbi:MAG: YggS family pyridoxal phosphate-dependent enzyme [Bacteroidales bacterium]|nr:YggS family pyridoxal phosphate-dependent enzyme [Bacteroidales bacterium]